MQQLINFLSKRKYIFLFLFIQLITLWLTIQNKDYHKATFINSTGNIVGSIYSRVNNLDKYINLHKENTQLIEENAKLHSMLKSSMVEVGVSIRSHSDTNALKIVQKYHYTESEVINNSYRRRNNHITIRKGLLNGINNGDGVVTSNGIIGVIENTGENYSSVISVLNKNLLVNAKLKKSNYFGSLSWPGKDRSKFLLSDIPKEAIISLGDTIITGGYSTIFPEGINIGVIEKLEVLENQNYYNIVVKPFLDYANVKSVYVIHNLQRGEINEIESKRKD